MCILRLILIVFLCAIKLHIHFLDFLQFHTLEEMIEQNDSILF